MHPNLRSVRLCSPGVDASILQRDLDAPLVPMALAAFQALCCQPCCRAPCRPAPGSLNVSLSARGLTPHGWCLEPESWKAQVSNTHVLSQMSLKTSAVVLLHRAAANQSLASPVAGYNRRARPVPWSNSIRR